MPGRLFYPRKLYLWLVLVVHVINGEDGGGTWRRRIDVEKGIFQIYFSKKI